MDKSGNLLVKPVEAKLFRNKKTLGKMSPYAIVKLGSQVMRTSYHSRGGKTPQWNETLVLRKHSYQREMYIEIWNHQTILPDKLIASAKIELDNLVSGLSQRVFLFHKDKQVGHLELDIQWKPDKNHTKQLQKPKKPLKPRTKNPLPPGTGAVPLGSFYLYSASSTPNTTFLSNKP